MPHLHLSIPRYPIKKRGLSPFLWGLLLWGLITQFAFAKIITREQIINSGARDAAEILERASTALVFKYGYLGQRKFAHLPQNMPLETEILMDGKLINASELAYIPASMVDKIEISQNRIYIFNKHTNSPFISAGYDRSTFQTNNVYSSIHIPLGNLGDVITGAGYSDTGGQGDYSKFIGRYMFANGAIPAINFSFLGYRNDLEIPAMNSYNTREDFILSAQNCYELSELSKIKLKVLASQLREDLKSSNFAGANGMINHIDASIEYVFAIGDINSLSVEAEVIDNLDTRTAFGSPHVANGVVTVHDYFDLFGQYTIDFALQTYIHALFGTHFAPALSINFPVFGTCYMQTTLERKLYFPGFEEYFFVKQKLTTGDTIEGNSELQPQQGWRVNISLNCPLTAFLSSTFSVFGAEMFELISDEWQLKNGIRKPVSFRKVQIAGASIELDYKLFNGLTLNTNYTFSNAKDVDSESIVPNTIKHSVLTSLQYSHEIGLTFVLWSSFFKNALPINFSAFPLLTNDAISDSAFSAGIRISQKLGSSVSLFITLENIAKEAEFINGSVIPKNIISGGLNTAF